MKIKKLIDLIEPETLIYILIMTLMIAIPVIGTLILSSNRYEDTINNLKLENKKLEYNNKELKNSVEILQNERESECHCGWYKDFYYEHADEVGAFE